MKYLCLVYQDEPPLDAMMQIKQDAADNQWAHAYNVLARSGHLLAAERMQPTATAVSIRLQNGTASVSNGTFAESKEPLAGYFLIDARDLNDAIRIAERIIPACANGIEVRPVLERHAENFSAPLSIS